MILKSLMSILNKWPPKKLTDNRLRKQRKCSLAGIHALSQKACLVWWVLNHSTFQCQTEYAKCIMVASCYSDYW